MKPLRRAVVTRWDPSRGFGFLSLPSPIGWESIFFHATIVQSLDPSGLRVPQIEVGRVVEFVFGRSRDGKGPRANFVRALPELDPMCVKNFFEWRGRQPMRAVARKARKAARA